jgi:hypothetical protein
LEAALAAETVELKKRCDISWRVLAIGRLCWFGYQLGFRTTSTSLLLLKRKMKQSRT